MREQRLTIVVTLVLMIISIVLILVRLTHIQNVRLAPGESLWRITYEMEPDHLKTGTKIRTALPYNTAHSRVIREKLIHDGLLIDVLRNKKNKGREAVAVVLPSAKRTYLLGEFDIHITHRKSSPEVEEFLDASDRASYLRAEKFIPTKDSMIRQILEELEHEKLHDRELADRIFKYCSEQILPGDDDDPWDGGETLKQGVGSTQGRARAMVALCRSRMPARIVGGFVIEEERAAQVHTWVEVYIAKHWIPYDPKRGFSYELANYLPVCYDTNKIVQFSEATLYRPKFSIHRLPTTRFATIPTSSRLSIVDLTRMSPGMQETLSILLLLPLGGLITSFFRNIVGIGTFGTFAPCLLALSFIDADWLTGIVILAVVLGIGISARRILDFLKLLIIPRLTIILTMVVLTLTMAVSILEYLKWTPSARAVLLPIVILTMLIEHFHIHVEEDGYRSAFKLMWGTSVVAIFCYLILVWKEIGRLALTFPEAQLFIIALLLLLGRYTGYRLTELLRFRDIVFANHTAEKTGEAEKTATK